MMVVLLGACSSTQEMPDTHFMSGNQYNQCVSILKEALASERIDVMLAGAHGLTDAQYHFEVRPMLQHWFGLELDDSERSGVAQAMAYVGDELGLVTLQDILLNPNSFAHVEAATATLLLGGLPDAGIVRLAADSSANERVRLYASGAMAVAGEDQYMDIIRGALKSADPIIQITAIDVLAEAGEAADTLAIEAVNAPDSFPLDQLYRSRALAILGDVDGRRSLRGLLQASDPIVRARATFAIAEAWMPESGGMLLQLLTDEDPLVRARAAHALILLYYPSSPYRGRRMAIDS